MNIREAKLEIENTLRAYLRKDAQGNYTFPAAQQRPILLMGPPGIGKTAIMEQLSRELGIGLVSYTMTHHTRQSAIGLPQITTQRYGGEEYAVTRYTMSEIIASVYDSMEQTGCREGILFLDEINCVSDTLAPTMLQFLQNKTFGTHRLPEGWVIAAAGNPVEYNKSVREFDIATLDRIRIIDVAPDTGVFLAYSAQKGLHGAVRAYLALHPERFYHASRKEGSLQYVTARGWEDLAALLEAYEALGAPVTEEIIAEYLRQSDTCREFCAYYRLYEKYGSDYDLPALLDGSMPTAVRGEKAALLKKADFAERYAVVEMLLHALRTRFSAFAKEEADTEQLHTVLKEALSTGCDIAAIAAKRRHALDTKLRFGLLTGEPRRREEALLKTLDALALQLAAQRAAEPADGEALLKADFAARLALREEALTALQKALENAITFVQSSLGDGQELTALLTGITASPPVMAFIARHGCPAYLAACSVLQVRFNEADLQQACRAAMSG